MPAATAVDAEPPIGGAVSRGVASTMGELGALDAMDLGDERGEIELGRSKRKKLGFANGGVVATKARRPA